jgi:hypothetical protein
VGPDKIRGESFAREDRDARIAADSDAHHEQRAEKDPDHRAELGHRDLLARVEYLVGRETHHLDPDVEEQTRRERV